MEETPSDNELFVRAEPITDTESLPEVQQCDPKDDDDTASQGIVDSVLFGGFISTDDNDEEAPALDTGFSPPQSPACPVGFSTQDKEIFDRSQIADQPRVLIDWPLSGRKIIYCIGHVPSTSGGMPGRKKIQTNLMCLVILDGLWRLSLGCSYLAKRSALGVKMKVWSVGFTLRRASRA